MLNKLNVIFQKFCFDLNYNSDDIKILKRSGSDKSEYFIIIELTELNNFLEGQWEYVKILKNNIIDKEVDKNSTLLICLKSETLPLESTVYKNILKIEEDPYYFRKLVLPYTQSQLDLIKEIDDFENIIKDPKFFEEFKEECRNKNLSESKYEVVSQLYIKLPFLKLPVVSQSKNIILDKYKGSLDDNKKKVLDFIENINSDDIVENEEFFKKLEEL